MRTNRSITLAIVYNRSSLSFLRFFFPADGVRDVAPAPGGERLTEGGVHPTLDLPDEHARQSRAMFLLSCRRVGEQSGLNSEADFCTQRPTRQTARWVFPFLANQHDGHRWRSGQRAGLQNLYSRVRIPPGAPILETNLQKKSARPRYGRTAREQWNQA